MIKKVLYSCLLTAICLSYSFGQTANAPINSSSSLNNVDSELFEWVSAIPESKKEILEKGSIISLSMTELEDLFLLAPEHFSLALPLDQSTTLDLALEKRDILTNDFAVTSALADSKPVNYEKGNYYKGKVAGEPNSWVAISIFRGEVMGVISSAKHGTLVLGDYKDEQAETYTIFASEDFKKAMPFECGVENLEQEPIGEIGQPEVSNPNNCIRIYFECEYNMYQDNGSSIANTINYMTGIYNVVKVLYDNESVNTIVSEIFVWDTPDSYSTSSTSNALNSFRSGRPSFNGDLAHLVSRGAPSGGGVAWLNVLCGSSYNYAYSYVYATYSSFPTYSWTVNVIAHEMGHNVGCNHTHDCAWDVNGDGTAAEAIDGCGPAAGYSGNGSCPTAPLPTNGGTVMSYCHLVGGVGINPLNGFGLLPGNRLRDRTYNGSCLTPCSSCPVQISTNSTNIDCNGSTNGTASASGSGGTSPYVYAWSNGANTASISGLAAGIYTVTVTDENGAGCSAQATVTITEPAAINLAFSTSPESLPGSADGSVNLSLSGGTPPYSYAWSNGATSQDLAGLTGGTYSVTVTDANGCTANGSATVSTNSCTNLVSSFPYNESFESGLGLWTQETSDNFDWSRRSGSTPTKRTGPSSASSGSWYVYTETNGNSGQASLASPCLDLTSLAAADLDFSYHMYGNQMGSLSVQISTNNGGSWTSVWSRSGNQGNSWQTATVSLSAYMSPYTRLRFVGTRGGSQRSDMAIDDLTVSGTIPPCNAPVLSMNSTDASCFGTSDGAASVSASGAVPPYSYSWSTGATSASLSGLSSGSYSVTVTDATGCTANSSVNVGEPAEITLTFSITSESSAGASDGAIDLSVGNGVAPFTYSWSTGASSEDINGLSAATYSVTVTDANGCSSSGSAAVTVPPPCGATASLPYSESFETGLGLWTQSNSDNFDWTRKSGSTSTRRTGPSSASNGTYYMYTESNGVSSGSTAQLESPCIDLTGAISPELAFMYHMYGSQMGALNLEASTDNGATWSSLWSQNGDQGNAWINQVVSLSAYNGTYVRLRFSGTRGGVRSDMAIDDVSINDAAAMPLAGTKSKAISNITLNTLYPNPTNGELNLELNSANSAQITIQVVDALGKSIDIGQFNLNEGFNKRSFEVSSLEPGVYILIVSSHKTEISQRFILAK